MITEDKPKERM